MSMEERTKVLEEQVEKLQEIVQSLEGKLDKSVERWTWERYQRMEKNLLPVIDKAVERWTWERYQRIEKKLLPVIDKSVERWTWERYGRVRQDLAKHLWNVCYELDPQKMQRSLNESIWYDLDFYMHNRYGSVHSAVQILSLLFPCIPHRSVVDFGCGIGTWLWVAQSFGAEEILGLDGPWVPKAMLMIPEASFRCANLEHPVTLEQRYELAMSLEVAEHLPEEAADTLVDSLCKAADVILFSAAHPGQGGDNHINEQPMEYWEEKFAQCDYIPIQIKQYFPIDQSRIEDWYRENIVLFARRGMSDEINACLRKRLAKVASK